MSASACRLETVPGDPSVRSSASGIETASQEKRRTFEQEALPHLDTVYRVALHLAGDVTRAEDLTQETMLKAYRAWHQYERGTNVRAWLLRILRNNFINEYRRQRAVHPVDIGELQAFSVFEEVQERDPEGGFFRELVDDEVIRALDALPPLFREAVILSDLEGMSYAEISVIAGVPVGTVKSRIFRGRRALQRRLYGFAVEMGYIRPGSSEANSE